MKKGALILACVLSYFGFSQSQFRQTVSGLEFNIVEKHEGKTAKMGDLVTLDMLLVADNGYEVKNTYKEGKPTLFPVKYHHHDADIYEAISLMAEGDSAVFLLNADSTFQKVFRKPLPEQVQKGSMLKLYAKVYKIRSQIAYKEEQEEQYQAKYANVNEQLKAVDEQKIAAYLASRADKDQFEEIDGVYVKVIRTGQGIMPVAGQAVIFDYATYLIEGKKVESSKDLGHPFSFTIGENNVIKGWEIAFPQLTEGTSFELIVPSHLAYGPLEKNNIPANSNLRFEIKLIKVQ